MKLQQILLPILLMGAFGAYALWMMSKRKKMMANLGPAFRAFFERTGYRYTDIAQAPLDEQVRKAEADMTALQRGTKAYEMRVVRDFHGLPVYHHNYMGAPPAGSGSSATTVMSCRWSVPLAQPPRVLWEVADRSLSGMGKAVKEAFSNMERNWAPTYQVRVDTGDAQLDGRFQIYAQDAQAAHAVPGILATPGMKEALLACPEVCLCVLPGEVYFSDPFQKNLRSAMGGTLGMMAMGFDMEKMLDIQIPVHDKITELLAQTARASA